MLPFPLDFPAAELPHILKRHGHDPQTSSAWRRQPAPLDNSERASSGAKGGGGLLVLRSQLASHPFWLCHLPSATDRPARPPISSCPRPQPQSAHMVTSALQLHKRGTCETRQLYGGLPQRRFLPTTFPTFRYSALPIKRARWGKAGGGEATGGRRHGTPTTPGHASPFSILSTQPPPPRDGRRRGRSRGLQSPPPPCGFANGSSPPASSVIPAP